MKKVITGIIIVTCFFVLLAAGLLVAMMYPCFPSNQKKAREIAENYLKEKYDQEMIYQDMRVSWLIDPNLYHVNFSPKDNPDVTFEVLLDFKFNLGGNGSNHSSADNYLLKLMEKSVRDIVKPEVNKAWSSNPYVVVIYDDGIYGHRVPVGVNEDSTSSELQQAIAHTVSISLHQEFPEEDSQQEMEKMLAVIKSLQEKECYFETIRFRYEDKYAQIDNWKTLTDVSQITLEDRTIQ